MNLSAPFIHRPIATTLLTLGLVLAGVFAFFKLPVSPLPQVDFPTISVSASMAGASPETMASSVATPLEAHLGQIADVTEMTSSSSVGSTRITLQFGLDRDADGAARDVQAAINAARADLPAALRSNPTYRKVNPADMPILILALTSKTLTQGQLYDSAATVLQQKLSQVSGVGQVTIGGSSLPAVRAELNPEALFKYQIGLEDVRAALAAANANTPKGAIETVAGQRFQVYTNDQARHAADYRQLVVAYRNGAAVRLADVARVEDSVEDVRNQGRLGDQPAVLIVISREPGANIIDTVDRVTALLPELKASIPADIAITPVADRTTTIRASLKEVERTLAISVGLVVLVVFLFLRDGRAALVPCVSVPVSLVGTFGAMYLLGYSLDNLSLMALTVATGFVVDDAIVVVENITRHVEAGRPRVEAALKGAREVGFTVMSISLSLVAVFIPIFLMGGLVGKLFREFAMTLTVAILVSLVISLTTTPMLCALLVGRSRVEGRRPGLAARMAERGFAVTQEFYEATLAVALRHSFATIVVLFATLGLMIHLYAIVPMGFFPQQDSGRLVGGIQADQATSFASMRGKLTRFIDLLRTDPAVGNVVGFTGGGQTNSGFVYVELKPLAERGISTDQVIARLRPRLNSVPGANLFLQSAQDIRVGGRQSNALYQFTLQGDDLQALYGWGPKITEALQSRPELVDVNSDQQQGGLEYDLAIDRATAARLKLTTSQIDNTLYDAFGQRQVSTIYNPLNQYHVIMEVAPEFRRTPQTLDDILISSAGGSVSGTAATSAIAGVSSDAAAANQRTNQIANTGKGGASTGSAVSTKAETMIPLSAVARFAPGNTPLAVHHQGPFIVSTISFNLPVDGSLEEATAAVTDTMNQLGVPASIHGSFQGTAQAFQKALGDEPLLILAALLAVYIVLGVLYESLVHPLTILSTLPSAGVGAVLALLACQTQFDIIAMIGVILLIGIVKKNAIMMIDFAIDAARHRGLPPREAIFEACRLRFRPIMMTTMAALFGALPLALGHGDGAELRQPLGITIVGGLVVSQILTLYTTPVIYLYLDRARLRVARWKRRIQRPGTVM